jgi:hypothetical protein
LPSRKNGIQKGRVPFDWLFISVQNFIPHGLATVFFQFILYSVAVYRSRTLGDTATEMNEI